MPVPRIPMSPAWEDAWLGYELACQAENQSPSSINHRRCTVSVLSSWLEHTFGVDGPAGVTRQHLQRYMAVNFPLRRHSGMSTLYSNLAVFFKHYAIEFETENPMAGIPRPRVKAAPVPVLKGEQIEAILKACSGRSFQNVRDRALVLLLLETGLRRTEARLLDVSDVDIRNRTVVVRCGKGGKARTSVFGPETAQAALRWLRKHPDGSDALFTTQNGHRLSYGGLGAIMTRLGEKAGVEGLRPHLFRHAWADALMRAGMAEGDIMQLAGWSTSDYLHKTYGASEARNRALAAGLRMPVASVIRGGLAAELLLEPAHVVVELGEREAAWVVCPGASGRHRHRVEHGAPAVLGGLELLLLGVPLARERQQDDQHQDRCVELRAACALHATGYRDFGP